MTFTFKISKRLALCYGILVIAAALSARAAGRSIVGAFSPDSAHNQPRLNALVTITRPSDSGIVGRRLPLSAV